MEAKLFDTKYGGIKSIYHNEALLRVNVILKDNLFTICVTDGVFSLNNSSSPSYVHLLFFSPVTSDG